MRKLKIPIILLIWLLPIVVLIYGLTTLKYGSKDLVDGTYIIKCGELQWIHQLSGGLFTTTKLINTKTKEELNLSGEDFSVKLGYKKDIGWIKNGKNQIQSTYSSKAIAPGNCKPVEFIRKKDKTSFVFYYESFKVVLQLDYICNLKNKLIHRSLSITSYNDQELVIEDVCLGNWSISAETNGGGKGLPVFVNDKWFFSGEEPWDETIVKNKNLFLTHHPSHYLKKDEIWTSDIFISGGGNENAKTILKAYIDKVILPPKFFSLYNTWYDLRENDLTSDNITTTFTELSNKLKKYGLNIDYCVIDDGWFNSNSVYLARESNFPRGLKEVSENIAALNSKLGLWLTFSGLYLNNEYLKTLGFKEANSKYFCLNGTNYFNALSNRLTELIKDDKISFFKHDFNYFGCVLAGHDHLRNISHSEEVNMRQTAKLLNHEREINPSIIQAITTGINLSPWWLKYANILYMGGGDIDFDTKYPATSRAETEMNYRDGKLYEILREKQTFFPLYALMTHGLIDGKLNSVGSWLNDDQWSDYVMNYMGRGTAIRELYLYAQKLNDTRSESLAKALSWAKDHNDQMLNSEMILGDPRKNEVYAFKGTDIKGNFYVSIRNPKFTEEEVSIDDLGINSKYVRIVYPYNKVCNSKVQSKIKIPAESVIVLESVNNGILGNLFGKFNETEEPVLSIDQKIKIDQFNIKDNEVSLNVEIPENATGDLVITLDYKRANINIEDNNVPIAQTRKTTFPDATWKVEIVPLNSGSHKISISSDKPLEKMLKLQLRARYTNTQTSNALNETINIL